MNETLKRELMKRFHGMENVVCLERDGMLVISERAPVVRHATFAAEPEQREGAPENEVTLSFSSEARVRVYGEDEVLSHHAEDCNLEPLRAVGAILKNHNAAMIVGAPTKVWLDEQARKGRLDMRFGTTEIAVAAQHEVMTDKTLRGVSVGFTVQEWVYLKDTNTIYRNIVGPAWVAAKWTALEASLTPIPADSTVGVNREKNMSEQQKKEAAEREARETAEQQAREKIEADKKAKEDSEKRAAAGASTDSAAEVERSTAIVTACAKRGIDPIPYIRSGEPLEKVYAKILTATEGQRENVEVTRDGRDSFRDAAMEGLALRSGCIARSACKHGGETMAGFSLMEFARESLKRAGLSLNGSKLDIAARALAGPRMDRASIEGFIARKEDLGAGTSDFPLLLAATVYKSLQDAYAAVQTHYRQWCAIGSVSDFKQVKRVEISEIGELSLIPELAPYTTAKFKDRQEVNQVFTYGKQFGLSRQAVINDDLDGFMRIPQAFSRRAALLPQILALKKLLANPVLNQDNVALFADGHANVLTGAGYALDTLAHAEAGLRLMRGLLAKQRAPVHPDNADEAAYLNLMPRVLLTNADDEFIAAQAVGSTGALTNTNSGVLNPINSWRLQVIAEQNIANTVWGGSATNYFLLADPTIAPVIEVVFLNGDSSPFMEEADQTNVDGRFWKVRLDVGANAIGFRGAAKGTGAG